MTKPAMTFDDKYESLLLSYTALANAYAQLASRYGQLVAHCGAPAVMTYGTDK